MISSRDIARTAAALIGFCLGYLFPHYGRLPNLYYDPIARSWLYGHPSNPIPMSYVGQCLHGLAGALVFFAIASLVVRKELSHRSAGLAAAWTLTLLMLSVSYFAWNNWP